jgi:putative restriction endonuclease
MVDLWPSSTFSPVAFDGSPMTVIVDRRPDSFAILTSAHIRSAAEHWNKQRGYAPFKSISHSWDVLIDGRRYPPKAITALAHDLAGFGRLEPADFSGTVQHGFLHKTLESLGFELLRKAENSARPASDSTDPMPGPEVLDTDAVESAAFAWVLQSEKFRGKQASTSYDVWVAGEAYPVKAICILALEALGYGRWEGWIKGEHSSAWDERLMSLGFQVLPKGLMPSPSGIRATPIALPLDSSNLAKELEATMAAGGVTTEVQQLVLARIGQGAFRKKLEMRWGNACALTGISERAVLRAAHIKRWAESDNSERLDPNNGLLLRADVDGLFEYGLVTFDDRGTIDMTRLRPDIAEVLGLRRDMSLRQKPNAAQRGYLAEHRERHSFR